MSASVRQLIIEEMTARLATIRKAAGYNTQPELCDGWAGAIASECEHCLWLHTGQETFGDMGLGGYQEAAVEIVVYGLTRATHCDLELRSNMLIQDVRNVLSSLTTRREMKSRTGAVFVGFDSCESDEGRFAEDGKMYFAQPVVWKYTAGDSW